MCKVIADQAYRLWQKCEKTEWSSMQRITELFVKGAVWWNCVQMSLLVAKVLLTVFCLRYDHLCKALEFKLLLVCDTSDLQDSLREKAWTVCLAVRTMVACCRVSNW